MSVKELVETAITENKVAIFSKSWCPYCNKAKALFKEKYPDVTPKVFELDERDDGDEIQDYLLEKTKQRTVPNIFVAQEHIGGSDDLLTAQRKGTLAPLLAA